MIAAVPAIATADQHRPAVDPQEVTAALRAVLDGSAYQVELPGAAHDPAPPTSAPDDPPPTLDTPPPPLRSVAKIALAILAVGGLAAVCLWLVGMWPRRTPRMAADRDPVDDRQATGQPARPLDALAQADRLAAAGDLDGAVHCLLIAALERTRHILDHPIAPSLTSREVVDGAGLAEAVRAALRLLVAGVEVSRFGGRTATAAVYDRCRESYMRIAQAAGSTAQ